MRKSYKLENLECANCATKMQNDISKIPTVNKASISFMTSKLIIDADTDDISSVLDSAQKICSKYEPDCKILR
ncbi:MAG: cation transporter [Eggerthellaceae bacterium]|nr:cation transporter [Eggerthellaceae bacterium]